MDLKTALIVGGIALVLFAIYSAIEASQEKKRATNLQDIKTSKYRYYSRKYLMTERENKFYHRLNGLVGRYWFIIPQVHLSAILNHKIKGQNWAAAFRHINGKSVDFVLISKKTGEIICAIELDDASHDYDAHMRRDTEINRIFYEAKVPLARFRSIEHMTDKQILDELRDVLRK